ncbi:hypothetical protein [Xylophilus sp. ASV27]|uniref:hypothetical protein n=1 Tax=Xylophilus sp. ASV27 TaxID=2795129 RepID=UPI0018EAE017|nr:hypothetical protein [Xylophilus sp. ASV27]
MTARRLPVRRLPAAWFWALLAMLALAPLLGSLHAVAHPPTGYQSVSSTAAAAPAGPLAHMDATAWPKRLFGDHSGKDDCRLYDQLCHGEVLHSAPLPVLPFAVPIATFDFLQGEFLVRWAALFDARGPPSAR